MLFQLKCRQKLHQFTQPQVMGIININADSFYESSRAQTKEMIQKKALQMVNEGATFLDLGAMSTRPGSEEIPLEQEISQIEFALNYIDELSLDVLISIDTYRYEVAQLASNLGADFINDISAGEDEALLDLIAKEQLGYIAMHKQGIPKTMQLNPQYTDVTQEIMEFFLEKNQYFTALGITSWCMDPGFGFGKTQEHNFQLMRELGTLKNSINRPMLIGISRKGMIYKTLGITAKEALNGTTALHMAALMKGANILRVHDVKEAVETVQLYQYLHHSKKEELRFEKK